MRTVAQGARSASGITLEHIAALEALGSDARFVPIGRAKMPVDPTSGAPLAGWSRPEAWLTAEQLGPFVGHYHVRAAGVILGPETGFLCLDIDTEEAPREFEALTGRSLADLPATVVWTSGKPHRSAALFSVPHEWQEHLRQRLLIGGNAAELRWRGHQSVIVGEHPETGGYQFCSGLSPLEVSVAEAPEWLLFPMLDVAPEPEAPAYSSKPGDARIARDLLKHIPLQDEYWAWLRVGIALHNTDRGLLQDWIDWSRPSDKFDEATCITKWQGFDKHYKGRRLTLGHLVYLAGKQGYKSHLMRSRKPIQPEDSGSGIQEFTPKSAQFALAELIAQGVSGSDLEVEKQKISSTYGLDLRVINEMARELGREEEIAIQAGDEAEQLRAAEMAESVRSTLTLESMLPQRAADALRVVAGGMACDDLAITVPFLAACTGVMKCGTRIFAPTNTRISVPINLFVVLIGESGTGKSPLLHAVVDEPLAQIRDEAARVNLKMHNDWVEANQYSTGKADPEPDAIYPVISEFTGEALTKQLSVHSALGIGTLLYNDELSEFFLGLDKYKKGGGSEQGQILKLFDALPYTSLRVVGNRSYERSHFSIVGGIQPAVFEKQVIVDGDPTGIFARHLLIPMPKRVVSMQRVRTQEEEETQKAATRELQEILQVIYTSPPRTYTISKEATEALIEYDTASQNLRNDALKPAHKAVYGKRTGQCMRIMGVLHMLRVACDEADVGDLVGVDLFDRAARMVDHLLGYAISAHSRAQNDAPGEAVPGMLRTIHEGCRRFLPNGLTPTNARTRLFSPKQRRFASTRAVEAAMRQLVEMGYGVMETPPGCRTPCYVPMRNLPLQ